MDLVHGNQYLPLNITENVLFYNFLEKFSSIKVFSYCCTYFSL